MKKLMSLAFLLVSLTTLGADDFKKGYEAGLKAASAKNLHVCSMSFDVSGKITLTDHENDQTKLVQVDIKAKMEESALSRGDALQKLYNKCGSDSTFEYFYDNQWIFAQEAPETAMLGGNDSYYLVRDACRKNIKSKKANCIKL